MFLLSWRNPTAEQADWDLDTYAGRILERLPRCKEITGSPDVNTLGFCAGGILPATVLNHLAATGDESVPPRPTRVTLLDFDSRAPLGAFSAPAPAGAGPARARAQGVITAPVARRGRSAGCARTTWSSTTWSTSG